MIDLYLSFKDEGGYTVFALSVHLSVRHTFLRNHASQPIQTWYGALARGPTFTSASYLLPVSRLSLFFDIAWSSTEFSLHFVRI